MIKNGQVEQVGTPQDIYLGPTTQFVSAFVVDSVVVNDYNRLHGFEDTGYKGAIIRLEFIGAFRCDNPRFKDMVDIPGIGTITDIHFNGSSYEVNFDVNVKLAVYIFLKTGNC